MQESSKHRYGRWAATLLLTAAGILFCALALPKLLGFFMPFVIAWVLTLITAPLVRWCEKTLHIRKKFGSIIVIILVLAAILFVLYLLFSILIREIVDFIPRAPDYVKVFLDLFTKLQDWLNSIAGEMSDGAASAISNFINVARERIMEWVSGVSTNAAAAIGNMALSIPTALFYLIITVLSTFFLVSERERLWDAFYVRMPERVQRFIDMGKQSVKRALGGYFVAQMKISWGVGLFSLIGLLLFGTDYALLLSLLISVADFLPVVGNGTVLLPWALIELTSGHFLRTLWLVLIYVGGQLVRGFLQPRVLGKSMGLPPLLTTLFIYLGYRFGGIWGMIFAVPLGMIVVELCQYGVLNPAVGVLREMLAALEELMKKPAEATAQDETCKETEKTKETEESAGNN